jgi:hypothetical protein
MTPITEHHRPFALSSYEPNRGTLVFGTIRASDNETEIDIEFADVWAVEFQCYAKTLSVAEADWDIVADSRSLPFEARRLGLKVYRLDGGDWKGFVVCGAVYVHETKEQSVLAAFESAAALLIQSLRSPDQIDSEFFELFYATLLPCVDDWDVWNQIPNRAAVLVMEVLCCICDCVKTANANDQELLRSWQTHIIKAMRSTVKSL